MLNQAFRLAHFICPERQTAIRIATAAAAKLDVAAASQDRRLYYSPTGIGKSRRKVFFDQSHLLQRLVYVESEQYEVQQEKLGHPATISEEIMIIRFIKHLARITLKRNSFYVTLGFSRLLFNYTTPETMAIYDVVVQDPDRMRDDYYYRRCKKRLLEELKDRFGQSLKVRRVQYGEERFVSHDDPSRYVRLVRECLAMFTPWDTICCVPDGFDPRTKELPRLTFHGENPDGERHVEVDRIHTVLHPDCYGRLLAALRLEPADNRLTAPKFALAQNGDSQTPNRHDPPSNLSGDELNAIKGELARQSERRKKVRAALVRVLVDGEERVRLTLGSSEPVIFEVDANAELIEVRADDAKGEVLLATHLISYADLERADKAFTSTIILEGGQEISFALRPLRDDSGDVRGASVEVAYREQSLWSLIKSWTLVSAQLSGAPLFPDWAKIRSSAPLIAGLASIVAVTASLFLFQTRDRSPDLATISGGQTPMPAPTAIAPAPSPAAGAPMAGNVEAGIGDEKAFQEPELRSPKLRSGVSAVKSLLEVKRAILIVDGDQKYQQPMRDALVRSLQSQDRINVTASVREADAALKITVERKEDGESPDYTARVVNKNGQMLWPRQSDGLGARYHGDVEEAAEKIVSDLINEITNLEKQIK